MPIPKTASALHVRKQRTFVKMVTTMKFYLPARYLSELARQAPENERTGSKLLDMSHDLRLLLLCFADIDSSFHDLEKPMHDDKIKHLCDKDDAPETKAYSYGDCVSVNEVKFRYINTQAALNDHDTNFTACTPLANNILMLANDIKRMRTEHESVSTQNCIVNVLFNVSSPKKTTSHWQVWGAYQLHGIWSVAMMDALTMLRLKIQMRQSRLAKTSAPAPTMSVSLANGSKIVYLEAPSTQPTKKRKRTIEVKEANEKGQMMTVMEANLA